MNIEKRFTQNVCDFMADEIEAASGNEVFFAGRINERGIVVSAVVAARGNQSSVPVQYSEKRNCDVLIHNHPSSNLMPSDADLAVASDCSENAQGFYIINNQATDVYVVMEPVLPRVIKKLDAEQSAWYLSKDGPFARKSENYEERPVQIRLVKKVCECFNGNKIGVFEAGTGVGKSFSYIIPSILWSLENKERIVISTGTINLQQQIIEKDIPAAEKIADKKVKAVLVKGRQNYVCLRRLEETGKERDLFESEQDVLDSVYNWAKTSPTGSKSDMPFMPPENLWQKVNSEADACLGMKCKFREKCFVMKVRKEALDANILVVNHHLLFADIASRLEGAGYEDAAVLPPYKRIIFDEAHGIEAAATSFFSSKVNKFRILKQLNLLYRLRKGTAAGYLFTLLALSTAGNSSDEFTGSLNEVRLRVEELDAEGCRLLENDWTQRLCAAAKNQFSDFLNCVDALQKSLADFIGKMRSLLDTIETDSDIPAVYETKAVVRRLEDVCVTLGNFLVWDEKTDQVFWIQKSKLSEQAAKNAENPFFVQLIQTPLDIAPTMNSGVFEPMDSVVCTSATLSIGKTFSYWKRRTGVAYAEQTDILEGGFDSPFPYESNVIFAVAKDAPSPEKFREFQSYVETAVVELIQAAHGKTLVLFTAYDSLRMTCAYARKMLKDTGITVLRQGDEDRFRLLSQFKEDTDSVLFATDSFWEGVDVPGKSLSQVIIVKLPFGVPSDPVFAARSEQIQKRGGSPFFELSVPDAVIKFRQGFGRLMRRGDDKGAVVVLDKRLCEKKYGEIFISSVPKTKMMYDSVEIIAREVERFFVGK